MSCCEQKEENAIAGFLFDLWDACNVFWLPLRHTAKSFGRPGAGHGGHGWLLSGTCGASSACQQSLACCVTRCRKGTGRWLGWCNLAFGGSPRSWHHHIVVASFSANCFANTFVGTKASSLVEHSGHHLTSADKWVASLSPSFWGQDALWRIFPALQETLNGHPEVARASMRNWCDLLFWTHLPHLPWYVFLRSRLSCPC